MGQHNKMFGAIFYIEKKSILSDKLFFIALTFLQVSSNPKEM